MNSEAQLKGLIERLRNVLDSAEVEIKLKQPDIIRLRVKIDLWQEDAYGRMIYKEVPGSSVLLQLPPGTDVQAAVERIKEAIRSVAS